MTKARFVELLTPCERTLYCVARTMLSCDADCADAVQEAIAKAWKARFQCRSPDAFRGWITRILINECKNVYRKRARIVLSPDLAPFEGQADGPSAARRDEDLQDALAALEDRLRLPVTLHYLEGFRIDEVARMLGLPSGTVKSRLHQARGLLKEVLSDEP